MNRILPPVAASLPDHMQFRSAPSLIYLITFP
jgi:hypothetical protein